MSTKDCSQKSIDDPSFSYTRRSNTAEIAAEQEEKKEKHRYQM